MNREKLGELAMEYISDYPLYVGGTSNITYDEAIAVAKAMNTDWQAELAENKRFEQLTPEQMRAEMERLQ